MSEIVQATLGYAGPFGRERVVYALPFNSHGNDVVPGFWYVRPKVLIGRSLPTDPTGPSIGVPGTWIPRMLVARWTEDTRRLAG